MNFPFLQPPPAIASKVVKVIGRLVSFNFKVSEVFHLIHITSQSGLAHLNLSYHWPSMLKQSIIHVFLLACAFGCCLKLKNQVSVGMLRASFFSFDCHVTLVAFFFFPFCFNFVEAGKSDFQGLSWTSLEQLLTWSCGCHHLSVYLDVVIYV